MSEQRTVVAGRQPQSGHRVLIRATVAPPQNQSSDDDVITVIVPTPLNPALVLITRDTIAEVLDPEWFPPQPGDVVVDRDGDAWQYRYDGAAWECAHRATPCATGELLDLFGPVVHVSRAGKPVEL